MWYVVVNISLMHYRFPYIGADLPT